MRRLLFLSLPLAATALFLVGCGSDEVPDTQTDGRGSSTKRSDTGGKPKQFVELDAPTTGTLRGKVIFAGTKPAEPKIQAMVTHNDHAICLKGPEREQVDQTWLVGNGEGVSDVYIKIQPPSGKKFKAVDPGAKEVVIDQPHCAYVPHVVAVRPGQVLKLMNSSGANHNSKVETDPSVQEGKNLNIPPGKFEILSLQPQKQAVNLSCQIHSWMSGKAYVTDNPYVAVTKEDGSFEIANVPVGVDLMVVGVHDDAEVEGGKEGTKHNFKAGDNDLTLKISKK